MEAAEETPVIVVEEELVAPNPILNGRRYRPRVPPEDSLDPADPQIKLDILRMIAQYLHNERYFTSEMVIQDEANMKTAEQQNRRVQSKRLRKAILEGDWELAASLTKNFPRQHHKRYLYAIYKQEYLELIERQEYQKAFAYLNRRLKPMEATAASSRAEFQNLCYLLTCKCVGESPHFMGWEGVMAGREKLAEDLTRLVELESGIVGMFDVSQELPQDRLVQLLQQAVAYQMEFKRYHPRVAAKVQTLVRDFHCAVIPNCQRDTFMGHRSAVKAVAWCGDEGYLLAAGGGDSNISIWGSNPYAADSCDGDGGDSSDEYDRYNSLSEENGMASVYTAQGGGDTLWNKLRAAADIQGLDHGRGRVAKPLLWLKGHASRIWDIACTRDGARLASASGDGTVKIWGLPSSAELSSNAATDVDVSLQSPPGATTPLGTPLLTLSGHRRDVYSVEFHPDQNHVVTGGHDRTVRLYDIRTGAELKTFEGHDAGVLHATTNTHGNLLISASRDSTIRFWDIMSGVCVKTYGQPLGAVTSVQMSRDGINLLTSSRHGPLRLWDVRQERPLVRYKGHQNTSSSFLRATFGAEESLVIGGSDCGRLHVWDRKTGKLVQKLEGHAGTVYRGSWNEKQSMVASSGEDGTVRTWWYAEDELQDDDIHTASDSCRRCSRLCSVNEIVTNGVVEDIRDGPFREQDNISDSQLTGGSASIRNDSAESITDR